MKYGNLAGCNMLGRFVFAVGTAALCMAGALEAARPPAAVYRLKREKSVWWLTNPAGNRFFSRGVAAVRLGAAPDKFDPAAPRYSALRFYSTDAQWREAVVKRLTGWNFNSLGAGADPGLQVSVPYVLNLGLGTAAGVPWEDPGSEKARGIYRKILEGLADRREDANLICYVLDGVLGWWDEAVFLHALKQDGSDKASMKAYLWGRLRSEYGGKTEAFLADFSVKPAPGSFDDLRGPLRQAYFNPGRRPQIVEEFMLWLADRYYRAVTDEIRQVDPGHLIFSDCYPAYLCQPVARRAARYVDGISVNCDAVGPQGWASPSYFESLEKLTRKPVLVNEFYFAAEENSSGNRNRNGIYMTVDTQAKRAKGGAALASFLAAFPSVVGYTWFRYFDQPPGGGEEGPQDFNLGLVDIGDRPYAALTDALALANAQAESRHGTWPAGAGVQRSPQGWEVRKLAKTAVADGSLGEWNLERAWIPETRSAAPFERFGDFYMSWCPEGLCLAVVYSDYRSSPPDILSKLPDTERLSMGFGIENEFPVAFTLKGIQVQRDPADAGKGFHVPEVEAARGGISFPAEGRFQVAQSARGVQRIVEVILPAELFRRESLRAGMKLRAVFSLRLRADFKELFWPVRQRRTDFESGTNWASLVLAE